ncbi:hypothetical protein [Rhizobium sp. 18065]|uniref:hypothetical protein n=1 Tax=Rhizobium sp. 18065 TaxID=2681411 RepID=UPI00135BB914|nr:hypothetical protein [Rhizobium sp. 18065]
MQAHRFPDGSIVAHKVYVNSNVSTMKHSVWFSKDGDLTDCEAIDKLGRSRPVSDKVRRVLATMYGMAFHYTRLPGETAHLSSNA